MWVFQYPTRRLHTISRRKSRKPRDNHFECLDMKFGRHCRISYLNIQTAEDVRSISLPSFRAIFWRYWHEFQDFEILRDLMRELVIVYWNLLLVSWPSYRRHSAADLPSPLARERRRYFDVRKRLTHWVLENILFGEGFLSRNSMKSWFCYHIFTKWSLYCTVVVACVKL